MINIIQLYMNLWVVKGDDDDIKNEKIIKNVLKEVVVNKGLESDT